MAPTLAPEALEGAGVLPIGSAFCRPLGALSLASTSGGPCAMSNRCIVCPRPVWPLLELGWPGMLLSICPLTQPLCVGLFGVLAGLLPFPALVRAAIDLAIWCPNSIVPSTGSVVMADLALTLSQASSFSLSALWAAIISWE